VVGRNHLSQVVVRAAVGVIGSSSFTGQVIRRSYSEKIGQAPTSEYIFCLKFLDEMKSKMFSLKKEQG
jgi:hypothetical protein